MVMRKLLVILLALLMGITYTYVPAEAESGANYKAVPGVTQEEINAIEALKRGGRTFSFGSLLSTEAFADEHGKVSGYSANLCALLSDLFGIQFVPALYQWEALVGGLTDKTIDFSGEFTVTPERRKHYFMSDSIAVRFLALFSQGEEKYLKDIAAMRTPIMGFMRGSATSFQLGEKYRGPFAAVYMESFPEVVQALRGGKIDFFVSDNVVQPFFEDEKDFFVEIYSPPIYGTVSLATQNAELEAVISVFDKYIDDGGQVALSALYARGMADYAKHGLRKKFTDEEKAYIDSRAATNKKVPVILESGNYPISFYNKKVKEFQGIVPDILEQVTTLTGLQFEIVNDPEESWASVLAKLKSGQAALISELLHTPSREGQFLWPKEPSCITRYGLLSTRNAPTLEIYQMLGKRIGVEAGTAYLDVAKQWFPTVEMLSYSSIDEAFDALDKGDIDLIMASENVLLSQTNYSEKPEYKVNFTIDYTAESKLGFNINEEMLLSIFDKTYPFTGNDAIVRRWVSRVFDYSAQLSQARVNLLLISTVLLAAFIALLAVFLVKNNRHRRDLSSLVKARTAQLEEKTATLSTIYNAIPDLLFSKDTQGKYTSCNPSFEAYSNLSKTEILNKRAAEIFGHLDPAMLDLEDAQDQEVIASGVSRVTEQLVTYPNGEQRLLETIKTPLCQNEAIVGMMGISRDITAHKAAEEAAQAASKAKSSFLARMSHEMRTPLNAIVGMAEITKASVGDTDKTLVSVSQIIVSSRHLLRLINDVLDMSKIEAGNLEVVSQPFSLLEAFEETLTIALSRCEEKNITFKNNVSQLANIVILGDKLRLNQVLINLLSNSAKFTESSGHIDFSVNVLAETPEDIRLRFAVKDNGIGMSAEQVARLFKPFEQADSSIASRFGGTGLGLSISQNLVQKMGGSITIDSEEGRGSEFSFDLLFKKGELEPEPVHAQDDVQDFSGFRILLVDDIEINRLIVEELLSPTNLTIEMATNGREAVDMFERSEPGYYQLIFMDIQMPELDGYEASTKIRALSHPGANTIPIIAMTANAYKEDVERALASGMNGHIGKPIDMDDVMKILTTHLTGTV